MVVPGFNLKVIGKRDAGKEMVYDIGVNSIHSFLAHGIVAHNCIPSRMTIAKMIEIVASKVAAFRGERVNATAFRKFNIREFKENLRQYGYNPSGKERMYSGFTGKPLEAEIFIGPCYYQVLRHHVMDKIQMRARGAIKQLSHQPVGGRARKGGQRFGEMERDAIISHGASAFLQERLCGVSDAYQAVYCSTCGTIAIANHASDKFVCHTCGDDAQFGTCTIPYAYKLLTHMLAGAGFNLQFGMTTAHQMIEEGGPLQLTDPQPLTSPTGLAQIGLPQGGLPTMAVPTIGLPTMAVPTIGLPQLTAPEMVTEPPVLAPLGGLPTLRDLDIATLPNPTDEPQLVGLPELGELPLMEPTEEK